MNKFVIVGGGTAGWLSALFVKKVTGKQVTVIASDDIPIIGAGEGSTGLLPDVVCNRIWDFGCNEQDFLKETKSTLKMGIKHENWRKDGIGYFGPIDFSRTHHLPIDTLQNYAIYSGADISLSTGNGFLFMQEKSSFFKLDSDYYQKGITSSNSHAYHFDAFAVGEYFKKLCIKYGVEYIEDEVIQVAVDETGIKSLDLKSGNHVTGDFFIDASGFKRVLSSALKIDWVSYKKQLPVDRAMPFIIPYKEKQKIPNYTLARALDAGWMWQIPTQERLGCGYVYSSQYCDEKTAQDHVEKSLGFPVKPIKHLKFDSGRLESFWNKNCLSIGLAAAFAEPLEATSIHTTIVQLREFCNNLTDSKLYNTNISKLYDDMRDFLIVHYLNGRQDTEFWKYVNSGNNITSGVQRILDMCTHKIPKLNDWEAYYGSVSSPLYNVILNNLGYLDSTIAKKELEDANILDSATTEWQDESREMFSICEQLQGHDEFIKGIKI